jgi:hypothetical protein
MVPHASFYGAPVRPSLVIRRRLRLSRILGPSCAQLIYAAACAFTAPFVAFGVPETRGRTLEEIELVWTARLPDRRA